MWERSTLVCVCFCARPYHLELFDFCISLCALCAKHSRNFCMNNKVEKAEKNGARCSGNNISARPRLGPRVPTKI